MPASYDLLLELPGIGSYTAGAIASIAYGIAAPAVDGNVLRVTMRYLNCDDDIMKQSVRKKMERAIMAVIPREKPDVFNQALMELGEVICIPNGKPLCGQCPLASLCRAHAAGREMELPVKPEKKSRRIEKRTVLLLEQEGRIGIVRRPEKGLLAGLWEFPALEGYKTLPWIKEWLAAKGAGEAKVSRLQGGKHIFSHVEWHMRGFRIEGIKSGCEPVPDLVWVEKEELENRYALPVAFHAFLQIL